jgi:hypothetical protein
MLLPLLRHQKMGLTAAKLLHHQGLGGGREDRNEYRGDSDDEWQACITHENLSLVEVTKKGDLEKVINLVLSGRTTKPCHDICARMASSRGSVDILKFLLQQQRASATAKSKNGYTALRLARLYENHEAVDFLQHTLHVSEEDVGHDVNAADSNSLLTPTRGGRSAATPPRGFNFLTKFPASPLIAVEGTQQSTASTAASSAASSVSVSPVPSPLLDSPVSSPSVSPRRIGSSATTATLRKPVSTANRTGKFQTASGIKSFEQLRQEKKDATASHDITFASATDPVHSSAASPTSVVVSAAPSPPPFIDASFVSGDSSNVPPPPPLSGIPPPPPMAPGFASTGLRSRSKLKPGVPLKALHWETLPQSTGGDEATLWGELAKDQEDPDAQTAEHVSELESLFAKKLPAARASTSSASSSASSATVSKSASKPASTSAGIIDTKRSQNIEIAIKRFRMTWSQIREAILQVDWDRLDAEKIQALVNCVPTVEETKQLAAAVETFKKEGTEMQPLGENKPTVKDAAPSAAAAAEVNRGWLGFNYAENFFWLLSSIPRCATRLKLLLFHLRFPAQAADVEESLRVWIDAATAIQSSKELKQLMNVVLTVGNYLNSGTAKGAAGGFRLTSLQLLESTKSNDGSTSLLDYICKHIDDRYVFRTTKRSTSTHSRASSISVQASESESERETEEDSNSSSKSDAPATPAPSPLHATSVPSFLHSLSLVRPASALDFAHLDREVKRIDANLKLVAIQLAHTTTNPTNKSATGEVDRFQEVMSSFHSSASSRLLTLSSSFSRASSLSHNLSLWFGEDPSRMDASLFFSTLEGFLEAYGRAERRQRERREREAKKAAAEGARKTATVGQSGSKAGAAVMSTPTVQQPLVAADEPSQHEEEDSAPAAGFSSGLRQR